MPGRTTRRRTGVAGLLSLLVAVALFWLFAPTTLGGAFSYVIVNGNSMSPRLVTGDLVLLRSGGDYQVGDAVAYHHPQLGPVLHRIVAQDGDRFTLRGDNRDGVDSYQPTAADVIGREWLAVPNGGRVIRELQQPRNIALLIGATILLGAFGGSSSRLRRRGGGTPRPSGASQRDFSTYSQSGRQLLVLGAVLAAGSLTLLGLYALNGPTQETTEPVPFSEHGVFSYEGDVAGGVYDRDRLEVPQPLYRQLTNELPLNFAYDLTSPDAAIANVTGTIELVVVVSSEDGWSRTFPLEPARRFASSHVEIDTLLELETLEQQLSAIAERTGIASSRYVLRTVARVDASGQVDGIPFQTSFDHFAQFRLSELQLTLDSAIDTLEQTEARSVGRPVTAPRVLDPPVIPITLSYARLPIAGGAGLGLAAVLLLVVLRATTAVRWGGEAARIRATYGALLVEMAGTRPTPGPRPQDVDDFADLVRLATAEGLAIMHRGGPHGDEYSVMTADRCWRYVVAATLAPARGAEPSLITSGEG